MDKFTKGPWEAGSGKRSDPQTTVYSDDVTGSAIADCRLKYVFRKEGEAEANALLIAAAPEMYEFIKGFADRGDVLAEELLAKARGES